MTSYTHVRVTIIHPKETLRKNQKHKQHLGPRQGGIAMRRQLFIMLAAGMTAISCAWGTPVRAASEVEVVAENLIELVKIGREVVAEHQTTINDSAKGEKGFTSEFVADQVMERFKKKTKIDLRIPNVVPQANFYLALLDTEKEVVNEAQPVINRPGVGFKGFLHAVFARRVGEHFYKKTGIRMKLTGIDYRTPNSKPDEFEQEVLRMFSDPRHPKNQVYVRSTMVDGRPVLRMMDPEYASVPCLACHGAPKGERDIMGMKKEGWKEGGLAGAISLVLPLKQ